MKLNKRGVEINVSTIIVVILAVLVLVVLALYFTGGMTTLWGKIVGAGSSYSTSDIESARTICGMYCSADNLDMLCSRTFDIQVEKDGKKMSESHTCMDPIINAATLQSCKEKRYTKDTCTAS